MMYACTVVGMPLMVVATCAKRSSKIVVAIGSGRTYAATSTACPSTMCACLSTGVGLSGTVPARCASTTGCARYSEWSLK
ncbi:hypothetical protein BU25DRAFT_244024 [Macroventuria anomochaeta]|uniref:Uncharacterized protein n=1 Tax=Macroventuria anomochaeta TaxID=301207 RepID=A0ACB6S9E9_9PLEO|nr:uncharacterized protein BU25DRAFT_244024 [Macroventuria anomochaeta]KAF2630632.1 hypothetical protein BU25DRAFT_244024 [Macroventuria anomochaeta]